MNRVHFLGCSLTLLVGSALADPQDLRYSQLEQQVRVLEQQARGLKREIEAQSRRIETLEGELRLNSPQLNQTSSNRATPTSPADAWLVATHWRSVQNGMSENEVIRLLGPPTSTRQSNEGRERTMFYSMELQAGFLSGQVVTQNGKVVRVETPALK